MAKVVVALLVCPWYAQVTVAVPPVPRDSMCQLHCASPFEPTVWAEPSNDRGGECGRVPIRDESGEEWLTLREAAAALGLSPATLRVQVAKGRLKARALTNRVNLISRSEVEAYKSESRGQRGRKPKDRGCAQDEVPAQQQDEEGQSSE